MMSVSPNRLFFLVTVVVFGVILYLLHQLGGGSSSSSIYSKSKILPSYDRTFASLEEDKPSLEFGILDVEKDSDEGSLESLQEKYGDHDNIDTERVQRLPAQAEVTTRRQNNADDIFYIDPPDHPVPEVTTKAPLVSRDLQRPGQASDKSERASRQEQAERYEQFLNEERPRHVVDQGSAEKNQSWWRPRLDGRYKERGDEDVLSAAWQKVREERHQLLEERIRWYQEKGRGVTLTPADLSRRRRLPPTDPKHWLGLNSSTVERRFPGLLFSREYRLRRFIDTEDRLAAGMERRPASVDAMTDGQAEDRFYQLLTITHLDCADIRRLGNTADGGWDVCLAEPYMLRPGCLVYSFGINFDFSFDDAVAETFGCEVRTFDPSMPVGDHMHQSSVYFYQLGLGTMRTVNSKGWRLETMATILRQLGHTNRSLDLVKLDVEFDEWSCLRAMLQDGSLRRVKQLAVEVHTPEVFSVARPSTKRDFSVMYSVLYGLERAGFRKYHFTYNPLGRYTSVRTGKLRSCCYEMYYVNVHYLNT